MVKKVGKYELGRSLGEGTFGKVKYALDTETNEAVAIKILDKEKIQKQNMGNQIKKEISIMKMVKHQYIVGMVEVLASKTKIFIVLELVTGGELFDKIVQVGKLSEEQARFYFRQLVEGVEYCHSLGVCHRDLKPENLLLDEHGNLKISDFGLSSLYIGDAEGDGATRTEMLHTTCGTPNYVAPEVLSDQGYDGKKADVWSCGVILYVLVAGFLPFDESTIVALFAKIQNADFTYPSWFSPELRAVLDQMLVADPKVRITLSQLKLHPWYVGSDGGVSAATGGARTDAGHRDLLSKPTDAQLEAAVQSLSLNDPTQDVSGGDQHAEDYEDADPSHPVSLNAFELVSHCGGFMLDRMFSPEIFYATSGDGETATAPAPTGRGVPVAGGKRMSGASSAKTRCYHYTSSGRSPQELAGQVYDAMAAVGFDFETSREVAVQSGVLKSTFLSAKGKVGFRLQVFSLQPDLNLLEIKKGKGDILEWNSAYGDLVEKRIAHLITHPSSADGSDAKAVF